MRRRQLLALSGLSMLASLCISGSARSAGRPMIRMVSDRSGASVGFFPIGLFVEPGQTVQWVNEVGVHTVTAYHPSNGRRPPRIPATAEAWDSGYLVDPGQIFERRFDVPGVYDYYCTPHEGAGMVGRLVVGEVSGPGAADFTHFQEAHAGKDWREIPAAARARFPDPHRILRNGVVPGQTFHQ